MRFEDFVLQLESTGGGRYIVQTPLAAQGQASGVFEPPFLPEELQALDDWMIQTVRQGGRGTGRHLRLEPEGEEPGFTSQEVGERLFRALLSEAIRPIYERELALAQRKRHGLRLRLKIDVGRPELLPLYNLPWELLYNPDTHDFLGLSRHTTLVRYLDVKRPESALKRPRHLRILAVMAEPVDLPPLNLEHEAASLQERMRGEGNLELVILEKATREGLHRALRERTFHILHFMGHGVLRAGEGCLALEDPNGQSAPIRASTLVQDLKEFPELQLVVLNACSTAEVADSAESSAFDSAAAALVLGGIPAVIGMRYPISDVAALAFSEHFYRRLAAGDPIDAAVTAGRQGIYRLDDESFEWAKPILFLRSQRSEIWPSRVWSQLKKVAALSISLGLAGFLGYLGTRPSIRDFLELHVSEDGRTARQMADDHWRSKLGFCGDSAFTFVSLPEEAADPAQSALFQLKGVRWQIDPIEVTEAARLDGIEYLARSTVHFATFRSALPPDPEWSTWVSPQFQPFTPELVISKVQGKWLVQTSSAHVPSLAEGGVDSLLALDCRWLQDGRLDPAKLKPVWADVGADLQNGNFAQANAKIRLGLAWQPEDAELLAQAAQLWWTQAASEPDPEIRRGLRRAAYQSFLQAARIEAARQPDSQAFQMVMLLEALRAWGCSQPTPGALMEKFPLLGLILPDSFRQLNEIQEQYQESRELAACD